MRALIWFLGRIKFKLISILSCLLFLLNKPKTKTVLVLEANNCHFELFPSFVKYLNELGYNVETVVHPRSQKIFPKFKEGAFVSRKYFFTFKDMKWALKSSKMAEYDFVLFTSFRLYFKAPNGILPTSNVFEHFTSIKTKKGTIATLHHAEDLETASKLANGVIVLSNVLLENNEFKNVFVVNPCYFKETAPKQKNKNVKFISTGKLERLRKNPNLMLNAAGALLKNGIKNFKMVNVGTYEKLNISPEIKPYILQKGRLSFEKMYKELQTSDFFLPLLDSSVELHKRYVECGTSGSFQLIRGFMLPPVIEKYFAEIHGFNETNAIVYEGPEGFNDAILRAINMEEAEYFALCNNLLSQREEIQKASLQNLKNCIECLGVSL